MDHRAGLGYIKSKEEKCPKIDSENYFNQLKKITSALEP